LSEILARFGSLVKNQFNRFHVSIFLVDLEIEQIQLVSFQSDSPRLAEFQNKIRFSYDLQYGIIIESLATGKAKYFNLKDQDHKFYKIYSRMTKTKSQLLIPISTGKRPKVPLGLIVLDYPNENELSAKDHQQALEWISGQFGLALRNILLYEKTNRQSVYFQKLHTAGLTLNKLYFDNRKEMIRMILLTISGFTDISMVVLAEKKTKYDILNIYKIDRQNPTTIYDITDDTMELPGFKKLFRDEPHVCDMDESTIYHDIQLNGREILHIPLIVTSDIEYYLLLTKAENRFTQEEIEVLVAFSSQAKITIENAELYKTMTEKQKLEKEIQIAKEIQFALLPKKMPEHPEFEFGGFMLPARGIGGDYYDFIISPDQKEAVICVGDVSGKGVAAGMVMATVRTIIHSLVRKKTTTWDVIQDVNTYIYYNYHDSVMPRFMTMTLIKWEEDKNNFSFTGAGHGNIAIYRSKTKILETIPTGGILLGVTSNIKNYFNLGQFELESGDVLFLYTDGVTEAMNEKDEIFEEERVHKIFMNNSERSPRELLQAIYQEILEFAGSSDQHDDITMVAIRKK
jgi:serine phosphatase RsbU (regulator of sigma subunit)